MAENPSGPLQAYVAPVIVDVVKCKVAPSHNGPLDERTGAAGIGFTITDVEAAGPVHPATVVLTL